MATLCTGNSYDLSQCNAANPGNKEYLYVKLTDSALRAIEEYQKNQNTLSAPTIQFLGNEGTVKVVQDPANKVCKKLIDDSEDNPYPVLSNVNEMEPRYKNFRDPRGKTERRRRPFRGGQGIQGNFTGEIRKEVVSAVYLSGDEEEKPQTGNTGGDDDDWGDLGSEMASIPNYKTASSEERPSKGADDDDWGDLGSRTANVSKYDGSEDQSKPEKPADDDDWGDLGSGAPSVQKYERPAPQKWAPKVEKPDEDDDWGDLGSETPSFKKNDRPAPQSKPFKQEKPTEDDDWDNVGSQSISASKGRPSKQDRQNEDDWEDFRNQSQTSQGASEPAPKEAPKAEPTSDDDWGDLGSQSQSFPRNDGPASKKPRTDDWGEVSGGRKPYTPSPVYSDSRSQSSDRSGSAPRYNNNNRRSWNDRSPYERDYSRGRRPYRGRFDNSGRGRGRHNNFGSGQERRFDRPRSSIDGSFRGGSRKWSHDRDQNRYSHKRDYSRDYSYSRSQGSNERDYSFRAPSHEDRKPFVNPVPKEESLWDDEDDSPAQIPAEKRASIDYNKENSPPPKPVIKQDPNGNDLWDEDESEPSVLRSSKFPDSPLDHKKELKIEIPAEESAVTYFSDPSEEKGQLEPTSPYKAAPLDGGLVPSSDYY